jgi:hypothetical protein
MNEDEWLACTDPELMLCHLGSAISCRKLRLFTCAWGYEEWQRMTDERSRDAVVVAEQFADGLASPEELISAFNAAHEARKAIPLILGGRHGKGVKSQDGSRASKYAAGVARNAANPELSRRMPRHTASGRNAARRVALANYLRDIFGNPFRNISVDFLWMEWNDNTIARLAYAIYDEYAFDRLPILADALEEAGCTDADILNHCRQPSEHVRGCWVVDLLLGKS